jgi:hypothetical protein
MNMPKTSSSQSRWLLLVHQLPARPSNVRVRIWRRLQQIGAVALRGAVYVLPNTAEAREDFEWIRTEIAGRGGQANILTAQAVDGYTDDELEATFRRARATDYASLIQDIDGIRKHVTRRESRARVQRNRRDLMKLRERFHALKAIDFFASPAAGDAHAALAALEELTVAATTAPRSSSRLELRSFKGRTWLTRPHPGIDRMASAWLIRRFIAPEARFGFGSLPAADGQIPFDMPDVEFGHHGEDCTFETLIKRFAIRDPAAGRLGQLVHDLDLKESLYSVPEAATIGRLVEGLRDSATSDSALIEDGIRMMEALYRSFERELSPAPARTPRREGTRVNAARRRPRGGRTL